MSKFNLETLTTAQLIERLDDLEDLLENPDLTDSDVEAEAEAIRLELIKRCGATKYKHATLLLDLEQVENTPTGLAISNIRLSAVCFNGTQAEDIPKFIYSANATELSDFLNNNYIEIELPISLANISYDNLDKTEVPDVNTALYNSLQKANLLEEPHVALLMQTLDAIEPLTYTELKDHLQVVVEALLTQKNTQGW